MDSVKYVLLLSRELTKDEKDEVKKWFCLFSYTKLKANNRTIIELLDSYDAIALNLFESEDKDYYAQSLKLLEGKENILKVFVGKLDAEDNVKEISEAYKIDFFVKKIPTLTNSKEELLHKIMATLLPKLKKKSWRKWLLEGLIKGLSYIIPKLVSSS
jgi:hypothetical protein